MTTKCENIPLTEPLRFLRSTVTSFNCSLGLGSQESTLNVDLVDDCDPAVQAFAGSFQPVNDPNVIVGAPVYFPDNPAAMPFGFGGVLTNWTVQQSSGGKVYNVKVSDPRQLLENTIIIIDSYSGTPVKGINYFNVYAHFEKEVLNGNCNVFGTSRSNERGMPYTKIIEALTAIDPTICSPTGYNFSVDFSSFPGLGQGRQVPSWYRVAGPSISILQLLQDICDVLAYDFYVELIPAMGKNMITVGLIDLKNPPASFGGIIGAYDGVATDLSYGQELRNEKTKMVLFGEQVHYLSVVNDFDFFFGEDYNPNTNKLEPVVPFKHEPAAQGGCGFWINKRIETLNLSLNKPLPSNGPYEISEMDIRCAMGSYEMWRNRAFDQNTEGTFNKALRANWPEIVTDIKGAVNAILNLQDGVKAAIDKTNDPNNKEVKANQEKLVDDLQKVKNFLANLGSTYYGKQFFAKLNQKICWYKDGDEENMEIYYTDVPTNAGGWVNNGPVLGLNDPGLGFFRQDDGRVGCFAKFAISQSDSSSSSDDSDTNPDYPTDDSESPGYTPGGG
jgi:hypothetical protein